MATKDFRFLTPYQVRVIAEVYGGDALKRLERYIRKTIQANAHLIGVGPITLNVTKWRSDHGLIRKAVSALKRATWIVTSQKTKKFHYLFVEAAVAAASSTARVGATGTQATPSNAIVRTRLRRR